MTLTLLTPILILFVLVIAAISAIRGYKRGMISAAVNFACAAASAFLSALLSVLVGITADDGIVGYLQDLGVLVSGASYGMFSGIAETVGVMLFCSVIFVLIFLSTFIISKCIVVIIRENKELHPEAAEDTYLSENATFWQKNDKRFGAIIGLLCGVFISVALASPLTGILRSTSGFINITEKLEGKSGFKVSKEIYEAREYSDDFMVVTLDALGGRMFFDMTTTTLCYGESTNISSEIRAIENFDLEDLSMSLSEIALCNTNSSKKLQNLITSTNDSVFLRVMILTGMRDMANSWIAGSSYLGVAPPDLPDNSVVYALTREALRVMASSSLSSMTTDFKSFVAFCNIINDHSSLFEEKSYKGIVDTLLTGSLINRLNSEVKANPRMAAVEQAVDNIMIQLVAVELNSDNPVVKDNVFEKIARGLQRTANIRSTDERIEVLSTDIAEAFSDCELYAPDALVRIISKDIVQYFGGYMDHSSYYSSYEVENYFASKYNYVP